MDTWSPEWYIYTVACNITHCNNDMVPCPCHGKKKLVPSAWPYAGFNQIAEKDLFVDKKKLSTDLHSMQHLKFYGRPVSSTSLLSQFHLIDCLLTVTDNEVWGVVGKKLFSDEGHTWSATQNISLVLEKVWTGDIQIQRLFKYFSNSNYLWMKIEWGRQKIILISGFSIVATRY